MKLWHIISSINLLQNRVNVFRLTRIMSSILPCKTWNAHCARATTDVAEKVTPKFIPFSKFSHVESSWLQRARILREKAYRLQNKHHWSWPIDDATDEWLPWWHDPVWLTTFSVAVSFRPDQRRVFWTLSLAIFRMLCNQLDSNPANLEATVGVSFFNSTMVAHLW